MTEKKKAFILTLAEFGHVNPMSSLAYGLNKQNFQVIFYGNQEQKEIIEKTGAEFRLYASRLIADMNKKSIEEGQQKVMNDFLNVMIDFAAELLPSIKEDFLKDQPDLILYDPACLAAKYLADWIRHEKNVKQPKIVAFLPNMVYNDEVIKENPDMKFDLFHMFFPITSFVIKHFKLTFKHRMRFFFPMSFLMSGDPNLNIVAIVPELQPRRELFDDTYKFVGPVIVEETRNYEVKDEKLKEIMNLFKPRPSFDSQEEPNENLKLVYVSLGTTFSYNSMIYEKIIKAFQLLNERGTKLNLSHMRVVVSLGTKSFEIFQKKIQNGQYTLPENMYIFAKVPQIEILKRASLFLTHSGQNSTSETIHYGVPIISIPIAGDQPVLARITCDKLKLGVRFDPIEFKPSDLSDVIIEVLTNLGYRENVINLSKTCRNYNGTETAIKLILEYMNKPNNPTLN